MGKGHRSGPNGLVLESNAPGLTYHGRLPCAIREKARALIRVFAWCWLTRLVAGLFHSKTHKFPNRRHLLRRLVSPKHNPRFTHSSLHNEPSSTRITQSIYIMVDQGPIADAQCPSYAVALGYMGVAAAVCLSNWGSAVSAQRKRLDFFCVAVVGPIKDLEKGAREIWSQIVMRDLQWYFHPNANLDFPERSKLPTGSVEPVSPQEIHGGVDESIGAVASSRSCLFV